MSNCNCNKLSGTEKATATGVSVVVNDPQTAIKLAMEDELNNYAKKDADNITEPDKWKEKLNYLTEEDIADKANTTSVTELSEKVDTKANQADLDNAKRDLTAEIGEKASSEELTEAKEDLQSKIDTKADNSELQSTNSSVASIQSRVDIINQLLQVNDDTLDELQEIVAYIKQNKEDLQNLGISNIAGLEDALGEKVDKEEGKGLSTNDFTGELKNKLENFSNLSTEDQTIASGVERSIDVQGRLNITGLEELEEDDITYSKKLVINEDGTLAQKKDKKPINVTFPSTINVKHSYPEALVKQESWTEEILEKVKKLETYDYEKFPISSANVTTGTFNNVEPTSARLIDDNRVIIEVKGALAREDTLEIKSWFEINNLDQNRDWVLKFKNFRRAALYNSVTLGLKYDNRAITSYVGESIGWTIGGYQTDRLGEYTFYFIKMAETITTVVVGENSPVAGMAVSSYVKEDKPMILFGKVSNSNEKLQVSNFEIKYL